MSQATIHGTECPVLKVFSNEFIFTIPNFQRPYAWTTEQASELIEDLLTFMGEGNEQIETLSPYFLGSIVLIKGDKPDAKVVDGQQRLTTLAILISVLRSVVSGEDNKQALTDVLYYKGKLIAGIPPSYRITLRERDNSFFQKYICHEDGIEVLKNLDSIVPESHKNIRDNALLFSNRLANLPEHQCFRLAQFILTRCFLIVVSTPDLDSAYRIFSVLNDRGLDLSHADILKAEIIGKIPLMEQNIYTERWEELEALLGRDAFQSLFAHIRMIYRKTKLTNILKEFREHVRPADYPQQFIDVVLHPYADAFYDIKHEAYTSTKGAGKVNSILGWLDKIDNADWLPPAILYYSRNEHDQNKLLHFFTDLERLAAGLMILRANVNKRIDRYAPLLTAIENDTDLYSPGSPLQLTNQEQKDIVAALNGDLYGWGHCKYVLLRLDEAYANAQTPYTYKDISVEHILPQHPRVGSTWLMEFSDEAERKKYVHRLGNLVLLTQKKNSAAQNYDFKEKVDRYFKKGNIDLFALTVQVINENVWTPETIERRQEHLVNKLRDIWRLN